MLIGSGNMTYFGDIMRTIGAAIDAIGVLVIVTGALLASMRFMLQRYPEPGTRYQLYRQDLGRAILLGLEFLIAGDMIRTVVVDPTLTNVAVLGLIVLIRTFLSLALHLEVEGRWPWQNPNENTLPPRIP
jgi:uncharacterized membrane protein